MELYKLDISQIHQGLLKKEFSAKELVKIFFDRIEKINRQISAFLSLTEDLAMKQAKEIDNRVLTGQDIPPLAGVPLVVKDNILVKGFKTTCASKILENYLAPYDATVIKKLKEKGAVILGKTNLDEFAMGSSTEYSAFFPTKNPLDLTKVPGGSSGGSAAAVAADLCCYALGSDTGSSVRLPACFCGVVGLKPTYGAVSRYGLVALASSLDQIGPITKTAQDAKIVFEAISGKDELDSTTVERYKIGKEKTKEVKGLRLGVLSSNALKGIETEVEKVVEKAIKKFEKLGAKIKEISLPNLKHSLAVYYLINYSEASSSLARYDGIRYGLSKFKSENREKKASLLDVYLESRAEGFGKEVKKRIILGTYGLSAGYYEDFYLKAQKVRTLIKDDFDKAFKEVDAIAIPTSPGLAFNIGEKTKDPLSMYLADIFTASISLAGLPAVSIPIGFSSKLPVGLQIIGKAFEENKILDISKIFEENG